MVAVYEDDFNFLSKMCLTRMREVAWEIASAARAVNAVVIAHGSDSTDNPHLFLENGFDYVLCGEAEETLAVSLFVIAARHRSAGNGRSGKARREWPSIHAAQ